MSDTFAYLIMCAVGGLILLIEAHRQFSSPIKFRNQSGYRILDHIELEDLAARRIVLRGYLFYLGLYLLVYVLLLTVVQLGDTILRFGEENGAQGDLSFDKVDTYFLDREGVARPIYIVVAMIALLSTGWAKKVEHVMRGAAHRMAGIPSGIFKTITQLNRLNYDLPEAERYLHRTRKFLDLHADDPDIQHNAKHILSGLRQIDYVAETVVTPLRDTVFAQQDIDALSTLLTKQQANMRKLEAELAEPDADPIKLLARIEEEKRNLQVLFSVLYFKDQSVEPPASHPPSAHLLIQLSRKPRDFVLNGLFIGAVVLVMTTFVLGCAIELFYASLRTGSSLFDLPDEEYAYRAQKALRLTVQSVFIFGSAGVLAAVMRSTRLLEGRWPAYTFSRAPFQLLLKIALLSALWSTLIATVVLAVPDFNAHISVAGYDSIGSAAMSSLQTALNEALRYGAAMVFVAITVLLVADQHDALAARHTALITLVGTVAAAVLMLMLFVADPFRSNAEALRDVAIFGVASLSFLLSYAMIVENAEGLEPTNV